jgi:hypothetical protein
MFAGYGPQSASERLFGSKGSSIGPLVPAFHGVCVQSDTVSDLRRRDVSFLNRLQGEQSMCFSEYLPATCNMVAFAAFQEFLSCLAFS